MYKRKSRAYRGRANVAQCMFSGGKDQLRKREEGAFKSVSGGSPKQTGLGLKETRKPARGDGGATSPESRVCQERPLQEGW